MKKIDTGPVYARVKIVGIGLVYNSFTKIDLKPFYTSVKKVDTGLL